MKFKRRFGWKEVNIPIVETAGEDIGQLIQWFGKGLYAFNPENITSYAARFLYDNVLSADGFILMCPVTRAQTQKGPLGEDKEPDVLPEDPDVNLKRLLQCIVDYKEFAGQRKVEGIAVLLSKYDVLKDRCKGAGMDCFTEEGRTKFMEHYFPQTISTLDYMEINHLIFLPVWIWAIQNEQKRPRNYSTTPGVLEYRVDVNPVNGRPYYTEEQFFLLIKWLQDHFAN
jgi:hypothetical protein